MASQLTTFTGGWLTTAQQDAVIGYPAGETYPGPVSEDHSGSGEISRPGRAGPPDGTAAPGFPSEVIDVQDGGGIVTDTAAQLGHSAPVAPFDAQPKQFAPSGPVADTHGLDTGGTYRAESVPQPRSPGWFRRVLTGQTMNRQSFATDTAGWQQNTPNDRTNLDQYQGQDADGYDPMTIPYSERPVTANFAAEAYPLTGTPGGYTPDGSLPDMAAQGGQGNFGYTSPPDPTVNVQPVSVQPAAQLGMEYLGG